MAEEEVAHPYGQVRLVLPERIGGKKPKPFREIVGSQPWLKDQDHLARLERFTACTRALVPLLQWCDGLAILVVPVPQRQARAGAACWVPHFTRTPVLLVPPKSNTKGIATTLFEDVAHELGHLLVEEPELMLGNLRPQLQHDTAGSVTSGHLFDWKERACWLLAESLARLRPDLAAEYDDVQVPPGIPYARMPVL